MKKINLQEFQVSKLTLSESLNTKGGSGGSTYSRRTTTRSNGPDADVQRGDND
jgi:hypothetical protein